MLLFIAGCATIPQREALPTYSINGVSYIPLISLCELRGINWEYDTFTKTVVLTKDNHKVNLRVGESLAIVDGVTRHERYPVELYAGTLAVSQKFKEEVLDALFKESQPAARPAVRLHIKRIVIDAGHGGNDPGAIGRTGLREKDVNLDLAKRLSRLLNNEGAEVVLTRSSDVTVPLSRRIDIANSSRADLFISIHSNANRVRGLSGFEIYYVSAGSDSKRALSSARDTPLDLERSYFSHASLNLKATLWDMIYTYNRAESIELAREICRKIDRDLETKVLGIKGAGFYVLKGIQMPGILIEIGFLSNPQEERLLRNNYYRQQIAEAILGGIENYSRDYQLAQGS